MINHKYKCIFIHIPRTGGSSIEKQICNIYWHNKEPETKHITASHAKKIYSEYWDSYFKFAFVRNPRDRVVSMASSYSGAFKTWVEDGKVNLDETDHVYIGIRGVDRKKTPPFKNSVYLNILDEELDFIGKFESYNEDFDFICDQIGFNKTSTCHTEKSTHSKYSDYYDDEMIKTVSRLYQKDIEHWNYKF